MALGRESLGAAAEDRGRRLGLGERADDVGLGRLAVGVETPGAQRLALAEAGVDDDAVEPAELVAELLEDAEDGVVVGDVNILRTYLAVGDGGVVSAVSVGGFLGLLAGFVVWFTIRTKYTLGRLGAPRGE